MVNFSVQSAVLNIVSYVAVNHGEEKLSVFKYYERFPVFNLMSNDFNDKYTLNY